MKPMLFAALLLLSGSVFAQCEKVEYVELKDWSVEDIEKRYCLDEKYFYIEIDTAKKLAALRLEMQQKLGHDSPTAARDQAKHSENSSGCVDELSKMARLLKNVYHKDRPACAGATTGGVQQTPAAQMLGSTLTSAPAVVNKPSKYSYSAEQFAKKNGCLSPMASMVLQTPGVETFAIACASGEQRAVRCEYGDCQAIK
jgi:hypothetical protein